MKKILLFLLVVGNLFSQNTNIKLVNNDKTTEIPVVLRKQMEYVSVKKLAEALNVASFYNANMQKCEIKFSDKILKFTNQNQYIVIFEKSTGKTNTVQMPVSSVIRNDEMYIPIKYALNYLSFGYGKNLEYDSTKAQLKITSEEVSSVDEQKTVQETNISNKKEQAKTSKYNINSISIQEKANGTLIRICSDKKIANFTDTKDAKSVEIKINNQTVDISEIKKVEATGLVESFSAENDNDASKLKFNFHSGVTDCQVIKQNADKEILITVFGVAKNKKKSASSKQKLDVVVIDAGHGGKDPGAIGINSLREKEVNLAVALKLGKYISSTYKDVKVVYTRKSDEFIELDRRGKIANEKKGKLFISIHCNSTDQKPTDLSGFEVYILRPGRTKEAIAIAERENSAIKYEENQEKYKKITDENHILASMAQSSYMKYSEDFADIVNDKFSNDLSISSKGVKQAGFLVLVGASMPSVLIELGFLSNRNDSAFLKSEKGQEQLAKSMFNSVKKFKTQYESE